MHIHASTSGSLSKRLLLWCPDDAADVCPYVPVGTQSGTEIMAKKHCGKVLAVPLRSKE